MKRIIDLIIALLLLFMSLPFWLIISSILWLQTGSNPIFFQIRGISLENQFTLYKFRTLNKSNTSFSKNIFFKNELSISVTKFGKILRKTGLDELPQLLNVIKGEMSLVGPRPLAVNDLNLLKEHNPQYYDRRTKLRSKPGISGMWQIYGDRKLGVSNLLILDELYEKKKSMVTDTKLMLKTIPLILAAKHSDSIVPNKIEYSKYLVSKLTPDTIK